MKIKVSLLALLTGHLLYAEPVTQVMLDRFIKIGQEAGVPRSVVVQLQIEESGDYKSGIWGKTNAQSRKVNGYRSKGVFQLYDKPSNINELLNKYWYAYEEHHYATWDIFNPYHNATVALRYLAGLHKQYGSWYSALVFYNCGRTKNPPEETKQYAKRIVNAK